MRTPGVAAALAAVAFSTLLVYALREIAPAVSAGVVYLVAVLVVASRWGLWSGLLTAVAGAATFNFFHLPPTAGFTIASPRDWVALAVFLAAAVVAAAVADLARSRAADAELAAALARVLLGGTSVREALPEAAALLGPGARIVIGDGPGARLDLGRGRTAAVVAPDPRTRRALPTLKALLAAALDRDELQAEVVETAALRQSDVLKTALLRAVSHDLHSPLTAIIAAGDAVRSPHADREELSGLIVGEAERLSRLVANLLDLSRLQAGAATPRRDWCSIEEVVRSAAEQLDAPVRLRAGPDLPLVRADAAQLERVFVNLLDNARRHAGDGPVTVDADVAGGRLAVRVIDHGPGIPPADLPHVFEPFRQGDGSDHTGSGLGLAIVRGFVEANDGRVWAESARGEGTIVAVELPVEP